MSVVAPPTLCDATRDPTACLLLQVWSRRPWDAAAGLILADRLDEIGECEAAAWLRMQRDNDFRALAWAAGGRRQRRRILKQWSNVLIMRFGDFAAALDPPPVCDPDEMPF